MVGQHCPPCFPMVLHEFFHIYYLTKKTTQKWMQGIKKMISENKRPFRQHNQLVSMH